MSLPYNGSRIPINRIKDRKEVEKSVDRHYGKPVWNDPISHPYKDRKPADYPETAGRVVANPIARRYPNGLLDFHYLAHKIIDVVHKVQDGEWITPQEEAILAITMPRFNSEMTKDLAGAYIRITDTEAKKVSGIVEKFLKTEGNWQAGQGGGVVDGANTIRER